MPVNDLHDIELNEVSLVDAGANHLAKVTLYKRALKTEFGRQFPMSDYAYVPDPQSPSTWKLRLSADPGGGPNARIVGAALAALGPTGFRGNQVKIPKGDLPRVKAKVLAAWKGLHPGFKEIPEVLKHLDVSKGQWERLLKSFEEDSQLNSNVGGKTMSPEELEKRLAELEDIEKAHKALVTKSAETDAALAKALEDIEALKKFAHDKKDGEDDDDEDEDGKKSMKKRADVPEDVKKVLDEQSVQLRKQSEDIAKMQDDAERKEYVAKAEADYANLPVSAEDIGEALRKVAKLAPDALEVIEKSLAAGNKGMAANFEELGKSGGSDDDGTAIAKLNKLAADISKRDGITFEKGFVIAKNENSDLWLQSRSERRQSH